MSHIRPSSLPKWAECPCFEGKEDAGPAASRGNQLDKAFRLLMTGDRSCLGNLSPEDVASVQWAVDTLRDIATGHDVITDDKGCHLAEIPLMDKGGTVDAVMPAMQASADLKSGRIYNYREQMAAYALGWMDRLFVSTWTTYLLFCDRREVIRIGFDYDEAMKMVRDVVARRNDPDRKPNPCEYCDWCRFSDTCQARVEMALATVEMTTDERFNSMLNDPAKLGAFLTACDNVEKFHEKAKRRAREILGGGAEVPGWKLRSSGEIRTVSEITVGRHIRQIGFALVLDAYGPMSADKFEAIWNQKMGGLPLPGGIIETVPKSMALVKAGMPNPRKVTASGQIADPENGWTISVPCHPDEKFTDVEAARSRMEALHASDVYGASVKPPLPEATTKTNKTN